MSEFYLYVLPNGIRCIHKRVRSSVVHCAMTINTGTRDEFVGEFGMAHLVEHTIFKGTKHRKAHHINCRLENLGGELNAYTSKEETVVHTTTLKQDFYKAVELISDIVFHSVFPLAEIEKEKEVICDEINLYKDSPSERIYDDFEDMIFEGSSLGHNILGSKVSLKKLNSEKIVNFIERTYNTDQMVFSTIGNISEKRFREIVDKYLAPISASVRRFQRVEPERVAMFDKSIGRGTHQVHSIVGNRAYGLNEERRLPLILLSNILGGPSANSRLNIALREKNALSYTVETSYTPMTDSGIFTIYFSCDKDKLDRCNEVLNKELERIKTTPLTKQQLSIAKKQFIGQFTVASENNEAYMLGVGKSYLVFNSVDSTNEVYERINRITPEDIMAVAQDIFTNLSSLTYK